MTPALFTLLVALPLCWGFNLEPKHAVVIDDPEFDRKSYFGYALGIWRQSSPIRNSTWLLVGAPRAQVEGLKGERVRQPGAVYKCSLEDVDNPQCEKISILGHEDKIEQDLRWRYKKMKIPKRAWIGATITVEDKPNGAVVVCAPRMKQMVNRNDWFIPGMCYYWQDDNKITPLALLETVYPFKHEGVKMNGFFVGVGQAGMSAHFVQNSTSSQLLVGAPGIKYFKGALSVYEQTRRTKDKGLPLVHMPTSIGAKSNDYLGYSVTSARLHRDGRVSYLAGAPRAEGFDSFTGAVHVMSGPHEDQWSLLTLLKGQQTGEYFGACVSTVDLDLDGVDDLVLVGAPLHSLQQPSTNDYGDHGRIYVFSNKGEGRLEPVPSVIAGSAVPGARFGSALAVIGDINKDGFNDVAVGAPYEGPGAVYIYFGHQEGLSNKPRQRISAAEVRDDLQGFGISISSGLDLDGNSFIDFAIGCYESSSVVIVKSYPVIDIEASLDPDVNNLDLNAVELTIQACLQYTTNAHPDLVPYINAEVTVRADPTLRRAFFNNETHMERFRTQLYRNKRLCRKLHVSLKGNFLQVMQPIEFSMYYGAVDNPTIKRGDSFCKMCPVTDPLINTTIHINIPFDNGCGGRSVCLADLKVEGNSSNKGKAIVLGEDTKITLKIKVSNSGELAYLVKMSLILPNATSLIKMPKNCYQEDNEPAQTRGDNVILCSLGNLTSWTSSNKTNTDVTSQFEVDVSKVGFDTSLLIFNVTTWSTSKEKTPSDNSEIIEIDVKLSSELELFGNTLQKQVLLSSREPASFISVIHKYEVINFGPSPVEEIKLSLNVPFGIKTEENSGMDIIGEIINPQITIGSCTHNCSVDYNTTSIEPSRNQLRQKRDLSALEANRTETFHGRNVLYFNCSESGSSRVVCASITCIAGPLYIYDTAELELLFNINRTTIDFLQQKGNVIQVSTNSWVQINDFEKYEIPSRQRLKFASEKTVLIVEQIEQIAPWVLPFSIAIGLVLFLLIFKSLSNVGFFHRASKEKMEAMKAAEEEFNFEQFPPECENGGVIFI